MKPPSLALRACLFAAATVAVALLGAWLLFGRGTVAIQTDLLAMLPATEAPAKTTSPVTSAPRRLYLSPTAPSTSINAAYGTV